MQIEHKQLSRTFKEHFFWGGHPIHGDGKYVADKGIDDDDVEGEWRTEINLLRFLAAAITMAKEKMSQIDKLCKTWKSYKFYSKPNFF